MSDLTDFMKQTILDHQAVFRAGMQAAELSAARSERGTVAEASQAQRKLDVILRAYEIAKNDPQLVLPTLLMCALEASRR